MKTNSKVRGTKFRRAFTIAELVIVIAVIAILAAVLIPTFAGVISSSKKSHDEQYVRQINEALSNYTVENGKAPENYVELMEALDKNGLCDKSNPYLLATSLKQDNVYLVWYPSTNSVILLDTTVSGQSIAFVSSGDSLGNTVTIVDGKSEGGSTTGYLLCNTGNPDSVYAAEAYNMLYNTYKGDIGQFAGNFNAEAMKDKMDNKSWANSIAAAIKNQQQGYSYSANLEAEIVKKLASSSTANINVAEVAQATKDTQFESLSDTQKTAVEQSVRSTVATLALISADDTKKERLSGSALTLDVPQGTVVDMSDVQMSAIGTAYRKDDDMKNSTAPAGFSMDFGGVELQNLKVEKNTFQSAGANYQDETDCEYDGGAFAFTYGIFGSFLAPIGKTITISNINITGVDIDLNGATELINGQQKSTVSDMAGIIAGYTQGNVVFKDINIVGAKSGKGVFSGYDSVAGIVGRCYANKGQTAETVTLENCNISNLKVLGQRRAAGFIGYHGGVAVTVKNSSLTNVDILAQRTDGKKATGAARGMYIGLISCAASPVTVDGVTMTSVTSNGQKKMNTNSDWLSIANFGTDEGANQLSNYSYILDNGTYYYLTHISASGSLIIAGNGLKVGTKTIANGTYGKQAIS